MKGAVLLSIDENLEEMRSLLNTLGIEIVSEVVQKRSEPHRNYFLGPGKIEEVSEVISQESVDLVVVNGALRPSQHHALEMTFQKECVDRVGIILRIFAEHAHTEEAKNQVTLATLRYEQPFLREWIHKAKSGERPGFLSGGAYATDVYYEHAKTHIKRIEENLERLCGQREVRRSRRRKRGYFLVSLAGYTNAGKSAMLNALCDTDIEVDDRLFSTLSTTTRRLATSKGRILLTDTVGFIKQLPPDLVDAFSSTLEEVFYSDLVLLLTDISEPVDVIKDKLTTSLLFVEQRHQGTPMMILGTKLDRLSETELGGAMDAVVDVAGGRRIMFASAYTRVGIDDVVEAIRDAVNQTRVIKATLPPTGDSYALVSRLHEECIVEMVETTSTITISLKCSPQDVDKIAGRIKASGGSVLTP